MQDNISYLTVKTVNNALGQRDLNVMNGPFKVQNSESDESTSTSSTEPKQGSAIISFLARRYAHIMGSKGM